MMTVGEIAENCGLSVAGDATLAVSSLSYSNDARREDIAVAISAKDIISTKAQVVLSEPILSLTDKTFLFCIYGGILAALHKVATFLTKKGYLYDYTTPPSYKALSGGIFAGNNLQIGRNARIDPFVTIGDNVTIGDGAHIESNVFIGSNTIIGNNCIIHSGARIGTDSFLHYEEDGRARCFPGVGAAILKNGVQIGYNSIVQRGTLSNTILENRVLMGNLTVVAHDVRIGADSRIVCQSGIAGGADVGNHVKILGQSAVVDGVSIGDYATLLGKSVATKDIAMSKVISGSYGREHKDELKMQARMRRL